MRVLVDPELCTGCGLCEQTLPELFFIGDYVAGVREIPIAEEYRVYIESIIADCPTGAISIRED
jgi:ferredoxin